LSGQIPEQAEAPMTVLVVLFNLKPGVDRDAYEAWARAVDLPTVNQLPSVERFRVLRSQSVLGSEAPAPYQYVEVLDLNSLSALFNDIGTALMQKVASEFLAFADAPIFIVAESL
jgi:hypothetical protein